MAEDTKKTTQSKTTNKYTDRDAHDLGAPMLPGTDDERTGPEDALGKGPKRGDYTGRIGPSNYHPHHTTLDEDGNSVIESQRERAEEIGDVPGKKGGVETADEAKK